MSRSIVTIKEPSPQQVEVVSEPRIYKRMQEVMQYRDHLRLCAEYIAAFEISQSADSGVAILGRELLQRTSHLGGDGSKSGDFFVGHGQVFSLAVQIEDRTEQILASWPDYAACLAWLEADFESATMPFPKLLEFARSRQEQAVSNA